MMKSKKIRISVFLFITLVLTILILCSIFTGKITLTDDVFSSLKGTFTYINRPILNDAPVEDNYAVTYDLLSKQKKVIKNVSGDNKNKIMKITVNPSKPTQWVGTIINFELDTAETCLFSVTEEKAISFDKTLFVNHGSNQSYNICFIPDSESISILDKHKCWIYDIATDSKVLLDKRFNDQYNELFWINSTTFLYNAMTEADNPWESDSTFYFGQCTVRKYDIATQEDSIYMENTYLTSISSNQRFVTYMIPDDYQSVYMKDLGNGEVSKFHIDNTAPFIKGGDSGYMGLGMVASPDGKYLAYSARLSADASSDYPAFLAVVEKTTNQIKVISQEHAYGINWTP